MYSGSPWLAHLDRIGPLNSHIFCWSEEGRISQSIMNKVTGYCRQLSTAGRVCVGGGRGMALAVGKDLVNPYVSYNATYYCLIKF